MLENHIYNSKDEKIPPLKSEKILEILLNNSYELSDFYNELVKYILSEKVYIDKTLLKNLKNDIDKIENDYFDEILYEGEKVLCFPYATNFTGEIISNFNSEEWLLIIQKILSKYISIFHKLEKNDDFLEVSEQISKKITELINSNRQTKYYIKNDSIISVFQNIHGDLSISKYHPKNINQYDLFTNKTQKLLKIENLIGYIFIYQYPENLISSILDFCYKSGFIPDELNQLNELKSNIPNATGSTDIDKNILNKFKNSLDNSNSFKYYLTHNNDSIYNINLNYEYGKIEIYDGNNKVFEINKEEMGIFIKILIEFPGRSINTILKLIEIYINKIKIKN